MGGTPTPGDRLLPEDISLSPTFWVLEIESVFPSSVAPQSVSILARIPFGQRHDVFSCVVA